MKVLHILDELKPSGAEMMLHVAAPEWREHGVRCGILATATEKGSFAGELSNAGYAVHHIPRQKRPSHFWAVRRLIREYGYGVVHQHLEAAQYWYSSTALAAGAAVVRTIHSNFQFSGWLRIVRGLQRRSLASRGVCFAVIGPGVQENELQRFGLRTELVLNWVAEKYIGRPSEIERERARRSLGFTDDDFVILSLGGCAPVKNHPLILQALARCKDLSQLRYLHIGTEDQERAERQLAAQLGIADKVIFAGFVPDALPAIHAADAYVQPSLYEGMSIASMEVLGSGVPGLFSDVLGLRDNAKFFPSLLYFSLDAGDLERVIRVVVGEGADMRRQRTATYPKVCETYFSPRRGVADYVDLYRRALAARS